MTFKGTLSKHIVPKLAPSGRPGFNPRSGLPSAGPANESTGWVLQQDAGELIQVDVSATGNAAQLAGKQVTVDGEITTRKYPKRGETRVLVARTVTAA